MKWTFEKPTEEGWYWFREDENDNIYPYYIQKRGDALCIRGLGWLNDFDGQFAGPMPTPEEAI